MAKRATTEQPYPTICIQEIHTTWTKQSRGGSGAVARNRVPQEVTLPEVVNVANSLTVLYHRLWYKEQDDLFALCRSDFEVSKTLPSLPRGVRADNVENFLTAYWEYDNAMGAPARSSETQTALELEVNQWGRIFYNGRYSPYRTLASWRKNEWWYNRWVFNLGIFRKPTVDVFVATQPVKIFSMMADLW